jgi:hypothetical protein
LGERLVRNEEVRGSNPLGSTTPNPSPGNQFLDLKLLTGHRELVRVTIW